MKTFLTLTLILVTTYVFAGLLPAPPIIRDEPIAEQQYFRSLYENHNILEITDTAPDGNIRARKGKAIIYNNSGTYELYINDDGDTSWQKI